MSKPTQLYYSSGQAARELGTSQAHVRALCEAGAIEARRTAGGQWRIPVPVVERLKRDGLPELPRGLPSNGAPEEHPERGHSNLLADPSDDAIHAADDVVRLTNEVEVVKLSRQKEEELEWFRERDRRREQEEVEQRAREEAAEEVQRQREWENSWIDQGLSLVPDEAPREVRLEVHQALRAALSDTGPDAPISVVHQIVEAAVEKALHPWRRQQRIQQIIEDAADELPWEAKGIFEPTQEQVRVMHLAAEKIARLRRDASLSEIKAAARSAAEEVTQGLQHGKTIDKLVRETWSQIPRASRDEIEDAEGAVRQILEELDVGASQREMERAREAALAPFRIAIAQREDQEMRGEVVRWSSWPFGLTTEEKEAALQEIEQAIDQFPHGTSRRQLEAARDDIIERYRQQKEHRQKKEQLIGQGTAIIFSYLLELQREWELDESAWALDRKLKETVQRRLKRELSGNEPETQVKNRVRRLVRQQLGIDD